MNLDLMISIGKELTKNQQLEIKGGKLPGGGDALEGGASVGCADGIEFNIRGISDQTAQQLCASHGGVAYMVLLP